MDTLDLINISFTHPLAKRLAIELSVGIEVGSLRLLVRNGFKVFFSFYAPPHNIIADISYLSADGETFDLIKDEDVLWINSKIKLRDLLVDLLDVLHLRKLGEVSVHTSWDLILDELRGIEIHQLIVGESITRQFKLLKLQAEELELNVPLTQADVICHNLHRIALKSPGNIQCEDLIGMNMMHIEVFMMFDHSSLTHREINLFLLHWVKGSNPRMRYYRSPLQEPLQFEEQFVAQILKGIPHRAITPGELEKLRVQFRGKTFQFRGYHIERNEGDAKAMISVDPWSPIVEVFVWF